MPVARLILLVEDNPVVKRVLENALHAAGYEVVCAMTASEALKAAAAQLPDLMILDLTLDSGSFDSLREGFAILHWLRRTLRGANFPVIVHTADTSPVVDQRAREAGVFAVIRKGDKAKDIMEVIRQALENPGAGPVADPGAAAQRLDEPGR